VVDPALAAGLPGPPDGRAVRRPPEGAAPSHPRVATRRRSVATRAPADLSALVSAARDGDPEALDALIRATYTDTYTLAYRLTGNDDDARDVVQEAYLRAHRGLPRFRGDAQFTTWLYRITANCASTAVRKRRRVATDVLADDAPIVDRRPDIDPEGRATTAEVRDTVAAALAALPSRLRLVIVLRDIYDLPHRDIARHLGISEAAAKVRLHRARRRCKEALEAASERDEGGPGGRRDRAR
jgi:RNA polymerase sigma-70 factor (ECF subfamily)